MPYVADRGLKEQNEKLSEELELCKVREIHNGIKIMCLF